MAAVVFQLIDVQSLAGEEVLNVYHFVDPAGTASEATLVSNYIADVIPSLAVLQGTALTHVAIRHRQVYPTAALFQETAISPPVAGSRTSTDMLPNSSAISCKWTLGATVVLAGGFTGHLKRGGMRIAGVTEDEMAGNALSSGIATEVQTFFAALQSPGGTAAVLCVASYLNGARVRQHTVQSYAEVTGQVNPAPSTQNTRKILRGRIF